MEKAGGIGKSEFQEAAYSKNILSALKIPRVYKAVREEKMLENKKRDSLEKRLKDELDWYTLYASDEEYDEKAVESILYLLDRWEPLKEETVPPVEESWKRFLAIADKKELLPVEDADIVLEASKRKAGHVKQESAPEDDEAQAQKVLELRKTRQRLKNWECQTAAEEGKSDEDLLALQQRETDEDVAVLQMAEMKRGTAAEHGMAVREVGKEEALGDMAGNMQGVKMAKEENSDLRGTGKTVRCGKTRKLVEFASRHKIIAAAVLVLLVLMVRNTVQVVANPDEGFFFWMKRDDSGVKMITSPEKLDDRTNKHENIFYNRDEAPEWAQGWLQIESEIEIEVQDIYELQYFEVSELNNRQHVASYFLCEDSEKQIVIGIWRYWDKVSYFREGFVEYEYVQSYEFAQKEIDVYRREENTGEFFYIVCFYDGNCQYYVRGQDNLDELKWIIEKCWSCLKNNF